jgi:hypothetical protein
MTANGCSVDAHLLYPRMGSHTQWGPLEKLPPEGKNNELGGSVNYGVDCPNCYKKNEKDRPPLYFSGQSLQALISFKNWLQGGWKQRGTELV